MYKIREAWSKMFSDYGAQSAAPPKEEASREAQQAIEHPPGEHLNHPPNYRGYQSRFEGISAMDKVPDDVQRQKQDLEERRRRVHDDGGAAPPRGSTASAIATSQFQDDIANSQRYNVRTRTAAENDTDTEEDVRPGLAAKLFGLGSKVFGAGGEEKSTGVQTVAREVDERMDKGEEISGHSRKGGAL